jgi:phosphatidyl-myo-inositol dimannoside synthase
MNLKKILLITSEFPPGPGGIGNHAYNLACQLTKYRYKINVIAESDNASRTEIENFDHSISSFTLIRIKRIGILTQLIRLYRYLQEFLKADILIASGKFPVWSINFLYGFSSSKNIISIVHGTEIRLPTNWQRKLFNSGMAKSNNIISVSKFSRSLLPQKLQQKTTVIPNGISFNYDDAYIEKGKRKSLNIKKRLSLLTVGNITQRKGQHRVIKALPTIIDKFPDTVYHIVGIPTNQISLTKLAQELKVEKHIRIHGKVSLEKLIKFYEAADIFIMLSENQKNADVEGFGISILEANFYGIPSIGANGCGIEDAIDNYKSGILVDGNNSTQILNAVEEINKKYDLYSSCAIEWADEHNWSKIINTFLKII